MQQEEKRQFRLIILIVFLGFLGISMPYLIFPALFLNPDYSLLDPNIEISARALLLGITLAAYPFGQFIGSPILGSLSDDYGRKKVLINSLWITALCYLLTAFAIKWQFVSLLIFSRFAGGIMEGNIAIARAMAADFTTLSKHKTFGKIDASSSIAYLIGPFLGGLVSDKNLWEHLNTSTPFYIVSVLFLILTALSAHVLIDYPTKSLQKQSFWKRINLFEKIRTLRSDVPLKFLMIVSTLFTLAVDMYYEFGPVYLTLKWDYSPQDLLPFNAILCITLALSTGWLAGKITQKRLKYQVISSCMGLFSLLLAIMVLTHSPAVMWVLFGLSGIVVGLAGTLLTIKISNAVSNAVQGEVMGMQVSFRVLGDALICLFGGAILAISPKLILIIAALLALTTMNYYYQKG